MKIDNWKFWQRIDDLLIKRNATIKDLSKAIGVGYYTITTQRNRKTIPKINVLIDIALYFNTSIEYLILGFSYDTISEEANAVENDPTLRHIVKLCMRDHRLLSAIELLFEGVEKEQTKIN